MKRTLVVLIATAAAAVLGFVIAANFFPDWTWEVLITARKTKTRIFGEKAPLVDLSKYALPPGTLVEEEQVSCPSMPRDALYDLAVPTPRDESCSSQTGDLSLENYGAVGNPLRGWVGCWTEGHDLKGVRINALRPFLARDRAATGQQHSHGTSSLWCRGSYASVRLSFYCQAVYRDKNLSRTQLVSD